MNEFLARLKQRKLVQWALAYLAAAWVSLQVLDLASGSYHWPDAVMHIAFGVLIVGFVVMLVLAWYHGERGAQRVSGMELLIVTLVLAVGGGLLWHFAREPAQGAATNAGAIGHETGALASGATTAATSAKATPATALTLPIAAQPIPAKSVAVLPFENLSTDKGNAYFADGMQDLILTKLADIGDLKVISRTSTEKYKSHPDDLKTVGQQLGVATILEGSVQKAGNQVLINVQLIDTKTDSHIWAQSYQRNLSNIFGVEGEVAEKIADALKAKLTSAESARVAKVPTTNAAAFNAFLQGRYYEDHTFIPGNDKTAVDYYRKAVADDPHFVLAWARLAHVLSGIALDSDSDADADADAAQAKSALDHALALAPDSPDVRMAQGWYLDYVKRDLEGALAAFDAVAKSQPNNAQALFGVGVMLGHKGQWQKALGFLQRAVALAPQDQTFLQELVISCNALRRYPEALMTARRIVAIDPDDGAGWSRLAHVYVFMGDPGSALAAYNEVPSGIRANPYLLFNRAHAEILQRNYGAARKLLATVKPVAGLSAATIEFARGDVERFAGDTVLAQKHYLNAKALLEADFKRQPNASAFAAIVMLTAKLGQRKEALAQVALSIHQDKASKQFDPFRDECEVNYDMAQFQVVLGNADAAVKALDWLLARPAGNYVSVPLLKIDPTWDPIRHDPRFQALLKKYFQPGPTSADNEEKISAAAAGTGGG